MNIGGREGFSAAYSGYFVARPTLARLQFSWYDCCMSIMEITRKITPVLKEYNVSYAGIFGSVARGDDRPESDVDIVVSVDATMGIYKFMELQDRLESAVGREVDLVSKNAIQKYLEPGINRDIVTVYEKR